MERRLHEHAFAKLNLSLDVLARRPDGYHDMEMVMQSVSLWDDINITVSNGTGRTVRVDTDKENLPRDERNLAGKAARIFLEHTGIDHITVAVTVTKRIPDRAGMAGGSSDAAAVIRGLDKLLDTRLREEELLDLCLRVGSDVPFCLRGGTALARGRGEVLTDLPPLPECGILVVKPEFSVSTPALFGELDRRGLVNSTNTEALLKALRADPPWEGFTRGVWPLGNVFISALDPVRRGVVEGVQRALLDSGAVLVNMTGTGSAVFGVYPTPADAARPDLTALGETFAVTPVGKLAQN